MTKIALIVLALAILPFAALGARPAVAASQPYLFASPSTVAPTGWVTLQGVGFIGGAIVVVIPNFPGPPRAQQVIASPSGTLYTQFQVPAGTPAGTYRVLAQISTYTPVFTTFSVIASGPYLQINPSPVDPGQPITVTGHGFTPNATVNVALFIGSTPTVTSTIVQSNGTFLAGFTVPWWTANGNYRITAQVSTFTPIVGNVHVVNAPQPTLFTNTQSIPGGWRLNVNGSGFTPNATVRVIAEFPTGFQTLLGHVSTQGTFSLQFPIPISLPNGRYLISSQISTFTPVTTWVTVSR